MSAKRVPPLHTRFAWLKPGVIGDRLCLLVTTSTSHVVDAGGYRSDSGDLRDFVETHKESPLE